LPIHKGYLRLLPYQKVVASMKARMFFAVYSTVIAVAVATCLCVDVYTRGPLVLDHCMFYQVSGQGYIYLYVRNTGGTRVQVTDVLMNGTSALPTTFERPWINAWEPGFVPCTYNWSLGQKYNIAFITSAGVFSFTETARAAAVNVNPPRVVYDSINGTIGTLFNITVKVTGVDDMEAWQVKMAFDDTIINVTRWYEPTWDPTYVFYGKGTLPVPAPPKTIYSAGGWTGVGAVLFPASSVGGGFTGDGLLCILTFNITATPPPGQICTCNFNIVYPNDTFWIARALTGETGVKRAFTTCENGYYEYMNP